MKRILIVLFICCYLSGLSGCACLKEGVRQLLAISTKEIENVRDRAIVKIVDYDYNTCYEKVEQRLIQIGSSIYARKKDLIAVYISQKDTTPAGVFFKEINRQKTQVEVASPAADTKEYLAERIFSILVK